MLDFLVKNLLNLQRRVAKSVNPDLDLRFFFTVGGKT